MTPGRSTTKVRKLMMLLCVVATTGCAQVLSIDAATAPASNGGVHRRAVDPAVGMLNHSGRWFTDANGRVVMLRGVNFVEKWAPFTPAADGFNDDDAALIAANGFNALRLGVPFGFVMPEPGHIDTNYLHSIAETVRILGRHNIYVLLDFHQDGWGPTTHGNGMPAWATYTDGLPNPPDPFPTYYVTNPALQRAFDNFWANRRGPHGVRLQAYYAQGMRAVAERFAHSTNVIGYEAMNEPWPGTNWSSCITGCPDLEAKLLRPFHARMSAAVRSVDPHHPVFVEPFVLFNFGSADTSLPGTGSPNVLSTHVYAADAAANASVMDRSVAAAVRDNAALLVTEWGATSDPVFLTQTEDQFDARLVPWMFWSYNGTVVKDSRQPLVAPNVDESVLGAITRPYPTLVNGTPTRLSFDSTTATFDFGYSTLRPDGHLSERSLETEVQLPTRVYPNGYAVTVSGAEVVSVACAPKLVLRNRIGAAVVSVRVIPGPCR